MRVTWMKLALEAVVVLLVVANNSKWPPMMRTAPKSSMEMEPKKNVVGYSNGLFDAGKIKNRKPGKEYKNKK